MTPAAEGISKALRALVAQALFAVTLAVTSLGGCAPADSLDEIKRLQNAGDLAGSIEPLRALMAERPDDAEVPFLYGRAMAGTATATEALWALRAAMDDPEWLVPAGLSVAAAAYTTHSYTVALDALERVLAEHPDNLNALLLRAQSHAASKLNFEQALADAEQVLEMEPDNLSAMEPRILALLALDRIDEADAAMEELGDLLRETQQNADVLAWHCATMAIFAKDGNHLDLARERWAGCLEEYPSQGEVVSKSVQFYDSQREFGTSLSVLQTALVHAPESTSYRLAVANRLRAHGEPAEAESLLREATGFDDAQVAVSAWLGLVTHFQAMGEYMAASEAAGRAVEVARQAGEASPQLIFDYADSLVIAGEYDKAAEVAATITVVPHRELVLGRSLLHQGDPTGALEHFSEALRLWPDNPFARYYAAVAAEEVGDFDRAIEEYRYAVRLNPGGTDARQRLAALHYAEGKPILALQVLRTKAHDTPLDLEGELLTVRLYARTGQKRSLFTLLEGFRKQQPIFGRAVASAARGLNERAGPRVAMRAIESTQDLRLSDPVHIDALRALVDFADQAGQSDRAAPKLATALIRYPESANLHALNGDALTLSAAERDEIIAAYTRALSIEPEHGGALAGMGEQFLSTDAERALAYFERAATSKGETDRDAGLGEARALLRLSRHDEARRRLEALLRDHPFDVSVARELAELERVHYQDPQRARVLDARIARFAIKSRPRQEPNTGQVPDPAGQPPTTIAE